MMRHDQTTIVITRDTRKILSHMKYELRLKNYDITIRTLVELRKGSEKFSLLKRFLGVK